MYRRSFTILHSLTHTPSQSRASISHISIHIYVLEGGWIYDSRNFFIRSLFSSLHLRFMLLNKLCAFICKYMRKYKFTVHNTGEKARRETRHEAGNGKKWMEHMYPHSIHQRYIRFLNCSLVHSLSWWFFIFFFFLRWALRFVSLSSSNCHLRTKNCVFATYIQHYIVTEWAQNELHRITLNPVTKQNEMDTFSSNFMPFVSFHSWEICSEGE